MDKGSWSDAEQHCNYINGHLWSINSFFEWWNLYNSFSIIAVTEGHEKDINVNFHYIPSTVLLFIGLQAREDDHNKVFNYIYNNNYYILHTLLY